MSCFDIYKKQYNTVEKHKPLGTLADDVSGEGCILPRHLIRMFNDKVPGTEELISVTNCTLKNANTRESIQLQTDENGCRVKMAKLNRDKISKTLDALQTVYDKNVTDRITELTAERDRRKKAYEDTLSEFTTLDNQLKGLIRNYNNQISQSNLLQQEKRNLQVEQRNEVKALNQIRESIQSETHVAGAETGNLQSRVLAADDFLKFVCITQHCDYKGIKNTFTPGLYSPIPVQGLSAIVIPPGMQIKLWTDLNYSGETVTLDYKDFEKKKCLENAKYNYKHTDYVKVGNQSLPRFTILTKNFNDNVKSVEVQKIKSILEYIEDWNGTI